MKTRGGLRAEAGAQRARSIPRATFKKWGTKTRVPVIQSSSFIVQIEGTSLDVWLEFTSARLNRSVGNSHCLRSRRRRGQPGVTDNCLHKDPNHRFSKPLLPGHVPSCWTARLQLSEPLCPQQICGADPVPRIHDPGVGAAAPSANMGIELEGVEV